MSFKQHAFLKDSTQRLLEGLTHNKEEVAQLGINDEHIAALSSLLGICQEMEMEQERLKAALKTRTKELSEVFHETREKASHLKKVVKLIIPQTRWREFGITDQR